MQRHAEYVLEYDVAKVLQWFLARVERVLRQMGKTSNRKRAFTDFCIRKLLRDFDGPFSASTAKVENPSRRCHRREDQSIVENSAKHSVRDF